MVSQTVTSMTVALNRPEIIINYSPKLDLRITLASVQGYGGIASPEYRFEVDCRLRHPSGSFTYSFSHLCFEPRSFTQFSEELRSLQQGLSKKAALKAEKEAAARATAPTPPEVTPPAAPSPSAGSASASTNAPVASSNVAVPHTP